MKGYICVCSYACMCNNMYKCSVYANLNTNGDAVTNTKHKRKHKDRQTQTNTITNTNTNINANENGHTNANTNTKDRSSSEPARFPATRVFELAWIKNHHFFVAFCLIKSLVSLFIKICITNMNTSTRPKDSATNLTYLYKYLHPETRPEVRSRRVETNKLRPLHDG